MPEVLLSIIIPCYNSFRLMSKGLKALEVQCTEETEVIVVDDCSTDHSYENLVNYAQSSPINLKVLKNEVNSGPGMTRNHGAQQAAGKYVTFLDADDYFSEGFIESCGSVLKKDPDCVIFDANFVSNGKTQILPMVEKNAEEGYISTEEAIVFTRGATWGKIYRRSIIEEHKLGFLQLNRNEDMPFTKCAVAFCRNIYYLKRPFYNYVDQEGSLMHNAQLLDPSNAQRAFRYIQKNIEKMYPEEAEAVFIYEYLYSTGLTNLSRMNRKNWKKYISDTVGMYPCCMRNKYLNELPIHVKAVVALMLHQSWAMLKILAWIKSKI